MLGRLHHEKEPCGGGVLCIPTNYESSYFEMCGRHRSSEYAAKGKMKNALRSSSSVPVPCVPCTTMNTSATCVWCLFSLAFRQNFASHRPQTLLVNYNIKLCEHILCTQLGVSSDFISVNNLWPYFAFEISFEVLWILESSQIQFEKLDFDFELRLLEISSFTLLLLDRSREVSHGFFATLVLSKEISLISLLWL